MSAIKNVMSIIDDKKESFDSEEYRVLCEDLKSIYKAQTHPYLVKYLIIENVVSPNFPDEEYKTLADGEDPHLEVEVYTTRKIESKVLLMSQAHIDRTKELMLMSLEHKQCYLANYWKVLIRELSLVPFHSKGTFNYELKGCNVDVLFQKLWVEIIDLEPVDKK